MVSRRYCRPYSRAVDVSDITELVDEIRVWFRDYKVSTGWVITPINPCRVLDP